MIYQYRPSRTQSRTCSSTENGDSESAANLDSRANACISRGTLKCALPAKKGADKQVDVTFQAENVKLYRIAPSRGIECVPR